MLRNAPRQRNEAVGQKRDLCVPVNMTQEDAGWILALLLADADDYRYNSFLQRQKHLKAPGRLRRVTSLTIKSIECARRP